MAALPFFQVDAFAARALEGNPCAVVLDADELDASTMQAIAREMNLSETAFVMRSAQADFRARYFTPAAEIPLAGHPTLSVGFVLATTGRLLLQGDRTSFRLELPAGEVRVEVRCHGGVVAEVHMDQRPPEFLERHDPGAVLSAFGLRPADLFGDWPVETVSTGTPQLMVPLRDLQVLRRASMDPAAAGRLRDAGDWFSAHLFCLEGFTAAGATAARHFVPPPLPFEDPFTGSATGGMGAWLWKHGHMPHSNFLAEQGHDMGRPGRGRVERVGPPDALASVRVGGSVSLVVEGRIQIDA